MSRAEDEKRLIDACRRVHEALDRFDHDVSKRLGISRNDLRCLNLLESGPVSTGHVAGSLDISTGSVTALVDRLEKADYVRRAKDPNDRRGVLIEATPKVYQDLAGLYLGLARHILDGFSDYKSRELSDAVRVLSRLRDACVRALD